MEKKCLNCGKVFVAERVTAKFDTPKCRVEYSRDGTPKENTPAAENIKMEKPVVKEVFRFKTPNTRTESGFHEKVVDNLPTGEVIVRTATRWYDVPISAIPVPYEGEPGMPEWMDGRQYFLWRENNFKMEDGKYCLIDPNPSKGKETFVPGGAQSRHWGA